MQICFAMCWKFKTILTTQWDRFSKNPHVARVLLSFINSRSIQIMWNIVLNFLLPRFSTNYAFLLNITIQLVKICIIVVTKLHHRSMIVVLEPYKIITKDNHHQKVLRAQLLPKLPNWCNDLWADLIQGHNYKNWKFQSLNQTLLELLPLNRTMWYREEGLGSELIFTTLCLSTITATIYKNTWFCFLTLMLGLSE